MALILALGILLIAQNLKSYGSGFDAYTSCYRTSRQRPNLPCDFNTQSWCAIPGTSYPWHAVRRFVHENQGLMKRMYGDERHISVLKAELDNNEIEFFHDADSKNDLEGGILNKYTAKSNRKGGSRRLRKGEKANKAYSLNKENENTIGKNTFMNQADLKNIFNDLSKSTQLLTLKPETSTQTTSTTPTTTTSTTNEPHTSTNSTRDVTTTATATPTESLSSQIEFSENISTQPPSEWHTETLGTTLETDSPLTTTDIDGEVTTEEVEMEEQEQEELYDDSEEQPEEDTDASEESPPKAPPILRLKGINACPVKEEVVAPFWANNTRGEVLALLNLYPFEQYVHWEKCLYENKQMFCRDGCRCEQQYRLHRLLAYDPNNECRGIFSDWFRFPSCCICKCYDVPMEFRLTSRSPRSPLASFEPGPT